MKAANKFRELYSQNVEAEPTADVHVCDSIDLNWHHLKIWPQMSVKQGTEFSVWSVGSIIAGLWQVPLF